MYIGDKEPIKNSFPSNQDANRIKRPLVNFQEFFPMLQASSMLSNTKFEGSSCAKAYKFWRSLIKEVRENSLIDHGIEKEKFKLIEKSLDDLLFFDQLIENYFTNAKEGFKAIGKIFLRIRLILKANRECYFPTGWTARPSGHHMILKIRKVDEKNLALSFLNKGGGANYHATVRIEGLKEKIDYQSPEVILSQEEFFQTDLGATFIAKLIGLKRCVEENFLPQHDAQDAYGLLALLGNYLPLDAKLSGARAGTPQRSGTCPETNTRLVIRDILLEERGEQYKKFIFAAKLYPLAQEYLRYQAESEKFTPEEIKILKSGAEELLIRLLKEEEHLSTEEFTLCLGLAERIVKLFDSNIERVVSEKSLPSEPMSSTLNEPEKHFAFGVPSLRGEEVENLSYSLGRVPKKSSASAICTLFHTAAETLKKIKERGEVSEKIFCEIFTLFRSLPLTSGKLTDSFWDTIEEEKIPPFISDLALFATEAMGSQFKKVRLAPMQMEIFARAYDLAAQLAPKIKECKLNNAYFSYSPPKRYKINWYDTVALEILKKIERNFKSRATIGKSQQFNCVFPDDWALPSNQEDALRYQSGMEKYLASFIDEDETLYKALLQKAEQKGVRNEERVYRAAAFLLLLEGQGFYENKEVFPLFRELTELSHLAHISHQWDLPPGITSYGHYVNGRWLQKDLFRKLIEKEDYSSLIPLQLGFSYISEGKLHHTYLYPFRSNNYSMQTRGIRPSPSSDENSSHSNENIAFHPLFKFDHHEWSEGSSLPPQILEDLLIIRFIPELQPIKACYWAADHIHLLTNPEIRSRLESLIFEDPLFYNITIFNPSLVEALFTLVKKGIFYFKNHKAEAEIFCWLGFLTDLFASNFQNKTFLIFQKKIKSSLETHLQDPSTRHFAASALIHQFYGQRELTEKELCSFLIYMPLLNISSTEDSLSIHVNSIWYTHRQALLSYLPLLKPEELDKLCNQAFGLLSPSGPVYEGWKIEGNYLKGGDYALHLDTLLPFKNGQPLASYKELSEIPQFKALLGKKTFFPATIQGGFRIGRNQDYAVEIEGSSGELYLKNILIRHEEKWWCHVDVKEIEKNSLINNSLKTKDYLYWLNSDHELLITDQNHQPLFQQNRDIIICLTTQKNLLKPTVGWENYLKGIEEPDQILFKGDQNGRVEEIKMSRLGLSWKLEGERVLSEEFKGFEWEQTSPPFLNGLPQAIYLKHPKTQEEKIIVPCWQFKEEPKSTFFHTQPSMVKEFIGQSPPYFVYNIERQKREVTSNQREGNLYLALIYRGQKDYKSALKALERASSNEKHSPLAVAILEEAYKQTDSSPMGCAFDCQLVDHFREHSARHSKSGTSIETTEKFKKFAEASSARYCRVTSGKREGVSAIPDYLVLSSTQEKKLKRERPISPVFEPCSPFNKMTTCKKEEKLPVNEHDIAWGATRVAELPYASLERLSTEMHKDEGRKKTVLLDLFTVFRSNVRGAEAFCSKILEEVPNEPLLLVKDLEPHTPLPPSRLKGGKGGEISIDENVNGLVSLDVLATLLSSHFNPPQIEKKELGPFPLKSSEDRMEQSMIHALEQGHNQLGKKTTYTLKSDRADLKKDLETSLQKLSHKSLCLEKDLQKRLETISVSFLIHEATYLNVAWKSGMISKPTLADLVVLLLSRNSSQLLKKNPSLSEREVKDLSYDFFTYLACASECAQIKEALSQLDSQDSFAIQKVGMLLDQKRSYKLHEYPEFLIYEWGTSKILREDQVKNLHAIYLAALKEGKLDLLLEFAAGGGKTKVMIPILAQMLARLGYLPVINTTSFLYALNKEDITESLHVAFKQMYELIEIHIDDPLPLEKLQSIQRALPLWKEEKKALYIQAESWDALFIARLVALSKNDKRAYEALDAIITFFETHGFRIVDESHQTDSPFTETLRSFGNWETIPPAQQKLLFKTYLYLNQLTPRLREGTLSQTEESEQKELLKRLKEKLLNDPLLKNVEREQLSLYLENPSKKRPEWLKNAPREIGNLVILTKALFTTFLPHIFSLRTHLDFGASIREGDLTVAPRQAKQPLRSHFAVHTLTTALTIQELFRQGINTQQMKMILSNLIQKILKNGKTELLIHLFGEKVRAI